jgi:hypothetical protein
MCAGKISSSGGGAARREGDSWKTGTDEQLSVASCQRQKSAVSGSS